MQDFSKEKCNIYVDFNTCLHNMQPFCGRTHYLYYARAWEMKEDKTTGANKANKADKANGANGADKTDRADKADKTNGVDKAD